MTRSIEKGRMCGGVTNIMCSGDVAPAVVINLV